LPIFLATGLGTSFQSHQVSIPPTFYKQLLFELVPKVQKNTADLSDFFAHLGSSRLKVAHKTLTKLTPEENELSKKIAFALLGPPRDENDNLTSGYSSNEWEKVTISSTFYEQLLHECRFTLILLAHGIDCVKVVCDLYLSVLVKLRAVLLVKLKLSAKHFCLEKLLISMLMKLTPGDGAQG